MNSASRESVRQGLLAMAINPLRTILSTLGIIIGVASVVTTLSLIDGLEANLRGQLETETDVQTVMVRSRTVELRDGFPYPVRGYPIFTLRDAQELQRRLAGTAEVTMTVAGGATVTAPAASPHSSAVTATLANYLAFARRDVMAGRYFTDGEVWRNAPVLVLSNKLARELSPNGDPARMLGRTVRLRGRPLTVVGVMPPFTGELGYQVFIPLRAAAMVFGGREAVMPALTVRAARIESVSTTKGDIHEWLAGRYRDWERRVSVTSNVARLEQTQTMMLMLKLVLGSLAGISLIVGGFGIMNVMLASVAERTREIGVHKALGARQRDILYQFLAEAVAIAGIGSGIGTAVGVVTAVALAAGVRWMVPEAELYAAVTAGTLLLSVLSAAIIGLVFGTFPALRAARLSPIDAIRHD